MRKVAIYARVSTDEQAKVEEGSIKNQAEGLERYIKGENLKHDGKWGLLVGTYIDDGYSAKNLNRPEIKRLLLDIYSNKVDTVLFTEISRLSRSVEDWIHLRKFFDEHKASFIASRQNFDTSTAMGRAMLSFAIEFAQLERELTAERVRASYQARAGRGLWTGGPLPYSLERTEKNGHLEVNSAKQVVAKAMFDILLTEAGSVGKAVEIINSRKCRREGGKEWDEKSFQRWIRSRALIGEVEINWKNKSKDQSSLPEAEKYKVVEAVWEPVIEKSIWERANNLLEKNYQRLKVGKWKYHEYILTGLLTCPEGEPLIGVSGKSRTQVKYSYYAHRPRVKCPCFVKTLQTNKVESVLLKDIRALAKDPAFIEEAVKQANASFNFKRPNYQGEILGTQNKIDSLLGKMDLVSDKALEAIDETEKQLWLGKLKRMHEEKRGLDMELVKLNELSKEAKVELLDAKELARTVKKFLDDFPKLQPAIKLQTLSSFVSHVEVRKDGLNIFYKNPTWAVSWGTDSVKKTLGLETSAKWLSSSSGAQAPKRAKKMSVLSKESLGVSVNLRPELVHSDKWLRRRDSNPRPSG